jgi:hypothetical protein
MPALTHSMPARSIARRASTITASAGPSSQGLAALQRRAAPMVVALPAPTQEPRVFARLAAAVEMDVRGFVGVRACGEQCITAQPGVRGGRRRQGCPRQPVRQGATTTGAR